MDSGGEWAAGRTRRGAVRGGKFEAAAAAAWLAALGGEAEAASAWLAALGGEFEAAAAAWLAALGGELQSAGASSTWLAALGGELRVGAAATSGWTAAVHGLEPCMGRRSSLRGVWR